MYSCFALVRTHQCNLIVYCLLLQRQSCRLLSVPHYAMLMSWHFYVVHAVHGFCHFWTRKKYITTHKIKLTQHGHLRLYQMHSKYLHLPDYLLNSCLLSCQSTLQKHCTTPKRATKNTIIWITSFHEIMLSLLLVRWH